MDSEDYEGRPDRHDFRKRAQNLREIAAFETLAAKDERVMWRRLLHERRARQHVSWAEFWERCAETAERVEMLLI